MYTIKLVKSSQDVRIPVYWLAERKKRSNCPHSYQNALSLRKVDVFTFQDHQEPEKVLSLVKSVKTLLQTQTVE